MSTANQTSEKVHTCVSTASEQWSPTDAYGELQALRNHVAHWRRSGIDDAALKRADDALADRRVQAPAVVAEKEQTSPRAPVDVSAFKDWTTRQKLGYVHQNLRWAACGYVHTPERIEGLRICWKLITDILESPDESQPPVQHKGGE